MKPRQLILTILVLFLLSGCSRVQFLYGQLDWLLPFYVESYVDLSDNQKQVLEKEVKNLLRWHCSTQLDSYANVLQSTGRQVKAANMSQERLATLADAIDSYWTEIKHQASMPIANLLLTMSDEQVEKLSLEFKEKNREWLDEFMDKTAEMLADEYRDNLTEELQNWFGPLQGQQPEMIESWSRTFRPLGLLGLEELEKWQQQLIDLLGNRRDTIQFRDTVNTLFVTPEKIRSADFLTRLDFNRRVTLELVFSVIQSSTESQRIHLYKRLKGYADDFESLACLDTDETPSPPVDFVARR